MKITSHSNYNRNKTKNCPWKRRRVMFSYDHSRKGVCQEAIHLLNSLNISYFLSYGSALGAVRNRGIIKGDADIDVGIPVWLNPHIFGCSEHEKAETHIYDRTEIFLSKKYRICGHNREYYLHTLGRYLNSKNVNCSVNMRNIHILSEKIFIDIWIFMSEEGVYRDISICRCYFCGVESYALEKAIEYSKIFYGNDCMTVQKGSKGKYRVEFDNPNKVHNIFIFIIYKIFGYG